MQLKVGDQMLVQFGTFGDRLVSVIVDIEPGRHISIFLKLPSIILDRIQSIQTVDAQFVHQATLMGFTTTILTCCNAPACVLQLAWPELIEVQDPRREIRLNCNFPGTLIADGRPYRCLVENLSQSGVRIRILHPTELNVSSIYNEVDQLNLDFYVLEERNRYSFSCVLLREFIEHSQRYAVLQISRNESQVRRILEAYVQAVFGALEPTRTEHDA
ncbi:MAG: flagellar brake protein [Proteobacteria bacterium]|nr:flagellar brake protein [Pseudomonadota bacterium]